jgi:hypothetical protein
LKITENQIIRMALEELQNILVEQQAAAAKQYSDKTNKIPVEVIVGIYYENFIKGKKQPPHFSHVMKQIGHKENPEKQLYQAIKGQLQGHGAYFNIFSEILQLRDGTQINADNSPASLADWLTNQQKFLKGALTAKVIGSEQFNNLKGSLARTVARAQKVLQNPKEMARLTQLGKGIKEKNTTWVQSLLTNKQHVEKGIDKIGRSSVQMHQKSFGAQKKQPAQQQEKPAV